MPPFIGDEVISGDDIRNAYPKMVRVIRHYTDAEIDAVADYLSRLPPPRVAGRE